MKPTPAQFTAWDLAVRRGIYRLCFVALAAGLLLPAAQRAEAQMPMPPMVETSLSITGPTAVNETDTNFTRTYTVTRSGAEFNFRTEITLTLFHGETEDADIIVPSSVAFNAGDDMQTFDITFVGDDLNESFETFSIQTSGGGPDVIHGMISIILNDNDPISVTLEPPPDVDPDTMGIQVNEATPAVFTVRLSGPSEGGVTVFLGLAGVGGVGGDDLEAGAPTDVMIPAGDLTGTFELLTSYDGEDETGEGFTYTINNVVGTATGHGQLTLGTPVSQTILLADTGPLRTLEVSAADANEGGNLVFTVTLTGPALLEAFDVAWSLDADMSSAEAADYSGGNSGMLNFTPSMQSGEVSFVAVDDALNEGPETLVLTVASPCPPSGTCAVGGRPSGVSTLVPTLPSGNVTATATIGASDPIAVSLARRPGDSGRLVNNEDANYVITLGATASTMLTIAVRGTLSSGSSFDSNFGVFVGETEVPVSFPGGRIEAALAAGSGEVQLVAEVTGVTGAPTGATAAPAGGGAASVSIPVVGWEISISPTGTPNRSQVGEGGSLDLTVSLRGTPAPTSLMVNWSVSGSGTPAATAADFPGGAFPSGTLDLSGQTSGTITVQTLADTVDESAGAEGFSVVLGARAGTNAGAATIVAGTALAEIADASRTFQVSVNPATTEGATANFDVSFTAGSMAPESSMPATVTWTLSGVEASDYTMPSAATGSLMFTNADWNTAQTVSVAIASDNLNEGSETLTLTLSNAAGGGGAGTGIATASASTTIAASDPITYRFDSTGRTFSEAGGANFTIVLDGATAGSAADITIPYTIGAPTSGIAAISGTDFTVPAPQMATIRAGDDQVDIFISGIDDDLNEAAESFRVILGGTAVVGAGGGAVTQGAGFSSTGTINDNDAITVSIADAADITEGSTAEFMVTLDHASATDVTVGYTVTTSGSPAPPFTDAGGGSLTITAPATTGIIRITADATNSINSGTRTITVALGTHTAAGAISGSGSQDVEVSYSTFSRSFAVAVDTGAGKTTDRDGVMAGVQVNEGDTVYFSVSLMGAAPETGNDASVMWAVSGASGDTTATGAALTFTNANYTAAQEVTFVVTDDDVNEAAESIGIALSGAMGGGGLGTGITTAGASVTIGASDPVTYNLVVPADVTETDSGTATMSFPVTLSGAAGGSAADITLSYTITSGTATGGMDYEIPSSPMVTISTGSVTANIDITINADNLNETNENIFVMLSNTPAVGSGGGVVTPGTLAVSGIILDDDGIGVTVDRHADTPATVDEGGTAAFTVTLNHASAGVVTVSYTVTSSTTGYTPGDSGGGSITFAAGETSRDITLTMPQTALGSSDTDGTVTVTLNSISAAPPGRGLSSGLSASATVMVNYVDAAHAITFASPATALAEGAPATTYTVTRTGPDIAGGASIVVSWTYTAGTAAPADFTGGAPSGGALTFTGSEMSETFSIAVADDADSEADETFTLGLSAENSVLAANGGVALGADVAVTIGESDRPVTLSVVAPGGGLTEGTAADFAVSFPESVTTTAPVTVDWAISFPAGTDAAAAADFTTGMMNGTASIPAGTSSVNVAITARADMLNEAEESFIVTLSAPAGGGAIAAPVLAAAPSADATIAASDPITVSVAAGTSTVNEGNSATFTVTLSNASAAAVMVPWTVNELSDMAVIGVTGGTLTFAAETAMLTQDIVVPIGSSATLDDTSMAETLTVTLGTLAGGHGTLTGTGATAMATVNWVTAAHTLAFTSPTASIVEGESATYTVTRTGPAITGSIVVSWTYAAGTTNPAAAADFAGGAVPTGGTFTFTGSETEKTFSIATMEDATSEPDESFTLGLTATPTVLASEGGVALPADLSVVIGESDQAVTLSVMAPGSALTEGTAADFAVSFPESVTTTAPVTVNWAISFPAGTDAAAAADFATGMMNGTASIAAGTSSVNVAITARTDSLNEAAERFIVTLSAPAGGGAIAAPVLAAAPSADATIAASDPITVSVAAGTSTVNEGNSATFTVTLSNASAAAVMVPWTVNELSDMAVIGVTGGTLTFAAETAMLTQDIVVPIGSSATLDDTSMAETLTVTLGTLAGGHGTLTGTGATAMATVNWVTAAHTLAFTSPTASIVEGESATYTVTRTGPAITGSIVVSWTYAAGTAAAADFAGGLAPTGGIFTFTGNETEKTFTIATTEDADSEPDESFTLGLTADSAVLTSEGGVSLPADLSVVIGASDQTVTLSVTAPGSALTEGTAANFRVSFPESVTTTAPVAVSWRLDNLGAPGAAANEDFDAGNLLGNLEIAAGQSGADLPITALADSLNEAEESFTLLLLSASGGGAIAAPVLAGTPSASAAIAASDPVTVSVAAGTATVNEGGSATFTVTLSNASAAAVMVPWTVNELSDADVIGVTSATLTFAAGTTTLTQDIVVPIGSSATLDDASPAQPLTVTLGTLAGGHGTLAGTGATATAMVSWVTAAHTVAFASPPMSITEGASATFVVTRTGPAITGIPIVVSWQVAADSTGSAEANDFTGGALPGGTVTFTGSQTMRSFVVATQDDNRSEMSETFTVGLSASSEVLNSNGGVAPGAATGAISITDNDIIRVSLTGPATVAENAPATYTVTLSAAPTVPVTMTWTVAAGAPSGDVIAAAAADFMDSVFPTGMLSFGVGVTSQSLSFTTTAGAVISGSMDNTPNRAFTIMLSGITGGGGMTDMTPPAAFTVTIREDDPVARTERMERMEQAATALNRATVALSVPVIARRFDPGRGLANPGLTLNLGGKPVLSPAGGGAASAGAGAGAGGYAATGGYAAPGGYAAIGLPKSVIPAPQSAIPAKAGIQHTNSPAPAGHQPDAGVGALPAPVAGAVLAQTPGGALSAAPDAPPAAGRQGERPSLLGLGALDVGALAELAASQLEGLDSLSPSTESRTLQQLLGNSGFSATSDRGGGRTVSVWGRGSYTSLDGEPEEGGNRYDYEGDSYAFFLGLDGRYGDYLAGLAVGYTVGDLELRTVSGPAAGAAGDRSDFESDLVAVYPYASWQPSDRLSVWLLGGYGQGELEIEERRGGAVGKATSDTDLWLGAAGLSWRRPTAGGGPDVLLRLSGTALHGETDGGTLRFGGAMPDETYSETETDAQQLRGEVELGQVFGFGDGGRLRPYLTAGVSYDFGDGARDAATGEFGTGLQLHWPRLGLETELEFQARLTSKDDRDYREYTGTGTLRYDLGGDRRGLQLALRPAFGLARGSGLGGADGLGASLDGGAFGGASSLRSGLRAGGAGSGLGSGFGSGLGLHSELSYGIGNVRVLRGLPGLLTLYGAGGLSAGAGRDLYRSGVRFEAARFTLDAGLRHAGGGGDSDTGVLLDGNLRF